MLSPEFFCHGFEFDGLLQYRIVAMPLDEVRSAHKSAMLAGSSVVMPQIEIDKIDRLRKWRACQHSVFAQSVHNLLGRLHALIGRLHNLFCLAVNAIYWCWCVALGA